MQVVQPEGPSFQVDGHNVIWQQWHLHVGFNFREGLVLSHIGYGLLSCLNCCTRELVSWCTRDHAWDSCWIGQPLQNTLVSAPFMANVHASSGYAAPALKDGSYCRYEDQGRVRPVCHRASTVEIIVPYGDPRPPFNRKCAFDAMDYGLGACANSLELGCDCLGAIQYFDGVVTTGAGERRIASNVSRCPLPRRCLRGHVRVHQVPLWGLLLALWGGTTHQPAAERPS